MRDPLCSVSVGGVRVAADILILGARRSPKREFMAACCDHRAATGFLAGGGTWGNRSEAAASSTLACTVGIHSRATRWICKSVRAQLWTPRVQAMGQTGERERPCVRDANLCAVIPRNATLWFVGDSTALSHAQVTACACALPLPAPHAIGGSRDGEQGIAKAPEWTSPPFAKALDVRHARLAQTACIHHAALRTSRRVCYIPAGATPHSTRSSVHRVIRRLLEMNLTTKSDLLVVNSGAWYLGHTAALAATHLADVRALVQTLADARRGRFHGGKDGARHALPRVFWREAFAQHFDTPDGLYSPADTTPSNASHGGAARKHPSRRCSAWSGTAGATPRTKPALLAHVRELLLAAPGVGVLDGWELTRARADAHPPSRVGDCTHYCIVEGGVVGGVYGALNNAMALMLQSSACRGRDDGSPDPR